MTDEIFDRKMDEFISEMKEIELLPTVTEKDITFKQEKLKQIRLKVEECINEFEVEDFLTNGPGKDDPN